MKEKTTFLAKASMMLFAVLFSLAANSAETAGVTLPYEYGFENNALDIEGWTIVDGASGTGISSSAKKTDSYGFEFYYNTTPPQYLISPQLAVSGVGVIVRFYYMNPAQYTETFMVGYSTTTNETDAFTWDAEKTAPSTWTLYENTFPASTKYVAVKYTANDQYHMYLDDFSFTEFIGVMVPTGLKVSYEGGTEATVSWASEDDLFDIDVNGTVTEDVENPYTLTVAYETEYTVKVRAKKDGKTSEWSDPVSFTTGAQFAAPTDVAAAPDATTATVTWAAAEGATGYNLRYKENDVVKASFEEGLGDWTTIDADGDGQTWYPLSTADNENFIPHDGEAFMSSASYQSTALTPDNYLVSPKVKLGGSITFWACAQDADWAAEHFGVAVSTTGNTDAADFTTIKEWTMTAAGTPSSRRKAQGTWGEYTVDLSEYAGQEGYVAIRHFNCSDWFRINVDDITITLPTNEPWTTVNNVTSPYTIEGLTPETSYQVEVQAVHAGGESSWVGTSFTTPTANPVPYNIDADLAADGAKLTWEGQGDSYKVRYRTAGEQEEIFFEDFENDLSDWTIYTEGEHMDGYDGWVQMYTDGENTNVGVVAFSYYNGTSYNADNWLITPAVELRGTLTFDVTVVSNFPDEYEVLLSTTGKEIADFTTTLQTMAAGSNGTVTIDLSAYEGQEGYIAIHHVSNDCYYLIIDNFGIYGDETPAGEWVEIAATDAAATISGLETNTTYEYQVQSIKDESESEWSESGEFSLVTLDCDGENEDLIAKFDGKFAHVTLANRTFYKDGTWNSIYLPFDLTEEEFNNTVLADGELRTLTSISAEDERIKLNFDEAMGMYASYGDPDFIGGFPYIIKWATGSNVVNPEFANVTISAGGWYASGENEDKTIEIDFYGTYDAYEFDAEEPSVLFIGENSKLYYPQAGAKIGATRGFFILNGVTAGESNGVKFYTNLDGDDATGIANISVKESGEWYDLSGRKLAGKPMQKGIYVNGGRKVTIK